MYLDFKVQQEHTQNLQNKIKGILSPTAQKTFVIDKSRAVLSTMQARRGGRRSHGPHGPHIARTATGPS
jgi:hypothetical protein